MINSRDLVNLFSSLSENGEQSDTSIFLKDITAILNVSAVFSKNALDKTVYQPLLSLLKKNKKTSEKYMKALSENSDNTKMLSKTVLGIYIKRQRRIFKTFSSSFNSEKITGDSDLVIAQNLLMINTALTNTAQNIFRFNSSDKLRALLKEFIFIQLEERKKLTYLIRCLKE